MALEQDHFARLPSEGVLRRTDLPRILEVRVTTPEIDVESAHELATALREALNVMAWRAEEDLIIIVDLAEVTLLSAAGVSALIAAGALADQHATELLVTGASRLVRQVLEICRISAFPGIDLA